MERQYQSESINELAAALAKAQGEMKHASKDVSNTFFKSRYAPLPAVIDAAKAALSKNGLAVVQLTDIDEAGKITLVSHLIHSSGQWMRSWYPVNPVKNDPQGLGATVTYSRRYSFMAIVGLAASDEDDDGNEASGNIPSQATPKEIRETAKARNSRWIEIKKAIEDAGTLDELQSVWAANYTHVQAFGATDAELADQLTRAKNDRKTALQQDAIFRAGMPEGFNNIK